MRADDLDFDPVSNVNNEQLSNKLIIEICPHGLGGNAGIDDLED